MFTLDFIVSMLLDELDSFLPSSADIVIDRGDDIASVRLEPRIREASAVELVLTADQLVFKAGFDSRFEFDFKDSTEYRMVLENEVKPLVEAVRAGRFSESVSFGGARGEFVLAGGGVRVSSSRLLSRRSKNPHRFVAW